MHPLKSLIFGLGLLTNAGLASQAWAEDGTAILAGGCFWCVESDFDHVDGVKETVSGYIGGTTDNPTYRTHSKDGHLEAVRIVFDKDSVEYRDLLDTFWRTVDVLDDGGQFCDRGNSYRTAVFVANDEERAIAEASKAAAEQELGQSIKTRILDASTFWPAEDYHQDYYQKSSARYNYYRKACGRDRRVKQVWGDSAFLGIDK